MHYYNIKYRGKARIGYNLRGQIAHIYSINQFYRMTCALRKVISELSLKLADLEGSIHHAGVYPSDLDPVRLNYHDNFVSILGGLRFA